MNGKKILIVDDNEVILKALSLALKKHEFTVVTALDGSLAVGAVRLEKPDAILLDISFPPAQFGSVEWDGFRIMQWLKRVEEAKNVPFILITGGGSGQIQGTGVERRRRRIFPKADRQ